MFEIEYNADGEVLCKGRLDAAQCSKAEAFMDGIKENGVLDFTHLEYISSAGLGILLKTQKKIVRKRRGVKNN